VKSPYAALLAVRCAEEREAEVALAAANRAASRLEDMLALARAHRHGWTALLPGAAPGPLHGRAGATAVHAISQIESIERQADHDLVAALAQVDAARGRLIERRRSRDAVERLHVAHLAEMARRAERRAQAELDGIATVRHAGRYAGNSF
jgi:flagellar export protein FliJ